MWGGGGGGNEDLKGGADIFFPVTIRGGVNKSCQSQKYSGSKHFLMLNSFTVLGGEGG